MALMTFEDQVASHISFLRALGLDVGELNTTGAFIRCRKIGSSQRNREEFAYKTFVNEMGSGKSGIVTWARGAGGSEHKHKTYGMALERVVRAEKSVQAIEATQNSNKEREAEKRVFLYFERYSSLQGQSKYLKAKNVQAIGVRFHFDEKYGTALVVPALDISGNLKTCLNINEDGSKRWLSGHPISGAFHALSPLKDATHIVIVEGYATAATVFEALQGTKIAVVCAFDVDNLTKVALAIHVHYPNVKILIAADNDRHLVAKGLENKGILAAQEVCKEVPGSRWVTPDFGGLPAVKELSDFNDLARVCGIGEVRRQLLRRWGLD